jgi:glucokinase
MKSGFKRIISLDIGGTKTKAAEIVNCKIVSLIEEKTPSRANKKQFTKFIFSLIEPSLSKNVDAICIGVPSLVVKGKAIESPNVKALNDFEIQNFVSKKFGKKVFVSNDAKCFALGEKYFGEARKYSNAVCITLGTGIGAGAIINGKVYFGKDCGASEIGRIPYNGSELEDYCSAKFFSKKGFSNKNMLDKKFKIKNKKIFQEFGKHMGVALAIVINIYNPEAVIFGGGISNDFDLFKKEMISSAKKYSYKKSMSSTKIVRSKNIDSALLGASMLTMEGM